MEKNRFNESSNHQSADVYSKKLTPYHTQVLSIKERCYKAKKMALKRCSTSAYVGISMWSAVAKQNFLWSLKRFNVF